MRGDSQLEIKIAESSHPLFANNSVYTRPQVCSGGRVYKVDGFRSSLHGISSILSKVSGLCH